MTQNEAKNANLVLARNSLDSKVFGDDIKLVLSLWFAKTFP